VTAQRPPLHAEAAQRAGVVEPEVALEADQRPCFVAGLGIDARVGLERRGRRAAGDAEARKQQALLRRERRREGEQQQKESLSQ